jgi:hypothetical protein
VKKVYGFLKLFRYSQVLNLLKLQCKIGSKLRKVVVGVAAILCIAVILFASYDCLYGFLRPQPDFEVSAHPASIVLRNHEGSSNATVITVKSVNGFIGDISLKFVKGFGIMGDIRFDLDSPDLHLTPDGQAERVLSLFVVSFVTPGEYYVDVVATSGQVEHTVRITVTVSH